MLQQYLPFTVLKLDKDPVRIEMDELVATVLTVYGIETHLEDLGKSLIWIVATVLTVYGIETLKSSSYRSNNGVSCNSTYRLRYWIEYYDQNPE